MFQVPCINQMYDYLKKINKCAFVYEWNFITQ